nr:venom carboxylesterase-6-like [Neodiprion pinetum]
MKSWIVATFLIGYGLCDTQNDTQTANPSANTTVGLILGYFRTSYEGRRFKTFEGIRYAEPPIGSLRFEIPRPVSPKPDVTEAKQYGSECLQYAKAGSTDVKLFGSEGCFLSTQDDVVPGNMGLKDQVVAMRWVKDNIRYFGGDPSQITIVEQSVGGVSVQYHYLTNITSDLFQMIGECIFIIDTNFIASPTISNPLIYQVDFYSKPDVGVEWSKLNPCKTKFSYLQIAGPSDINMNSSANFGDNRFWESINFQENMISLDDLMEVVK